MKYENEITVTVNMQRNELIALLEKEGYKKIDNYTVDDIYYVAKETDLNQNTLDILKKSIIIRSIDDEKHYFVYKYKEYDRDENIIKQGKAKVQIYNKDDAKTFLNEIGYKELIHINDLIEVYEKEGLELCIEYVNEKYLYIEIEENEKYLYIEIEENEKYNTVEKLILGLEKTNIKYDKNNYFVKKAKTIFESMKN